MNHLFSLFLIGLLSLGTVAQVQNLNFLKTCIKKHCFDTRLADSSLLRTRGLIGEAFLPESEGMLFVFPAEGHPTFWMKDTLIPLDILFINNDDIIVYIVKNAPPCKDENCPVFKPTRLASNVLEINGGLSKKLGISVGDSVMYFMVDDTD